MSKPLSPIEYSERIKETMPPLAVKKSSSELYAYNDKYYEPVTEHELNQFIYNYFVLGVPADKINPQPDNWNTARSKQISDALVLHPTIKQVDEFDSSQDLLNINNGVLDISDISNPKLIPHHRDQEFSSIIDVTYDKNKTEAPNYKRFVESTFTELKSPETPDFEAIDAINQLGGYLLYPKNKIEGFFMFLGGGANGKSLLIEIYRSFFDDKFVTDMSLKAMAQESSLERSQLIYSRLNISGEEKGRPIDAEQIKKISSGQHILISRKFMEPMTIKPNTKIIVDSNTIPHFKDHTHGTMRRLNLFKFPNKFVSKKDYETLKEPLLKRTFLMENRDTLLPAIMDEKSAIFNIFLSALKTLQKNNWRFPVTNNSTSMLEEYNEETDTLGSWLEETYFPTPTKDRDEFNTEAVTTILNDFQEYYQIHFPSTRFPYSSKGIARRINVVFGEERVVKNVKIGEQWTTVSAYHLTKKTNTTLWQPSKTPTNTPPDQSLSQSFNL